MKINNYRLTICDSLSFIWQYKEMFVDEFYKFQSKSNQPLIYDCGSNIGLSCLYFKTIYPNAQIKAFEADPKIADILKKNMIDNNCQDIEVHNIAVWVRDEIVQFNSEGADAGSITLGDGKNKVNIQAIRLKTMLEKEKKIDMLKMDIEGAESAVIEDCQDFLNKIDHIFIEYHNDTNSQSLDKMLYTLTKNGFRYYLETANKIKTPLLKDANKINFQTNIFAVKQ